MKVLVIPDVHLKPHMFSESAAIYRQLKEQELSLPEDERQPLGVVCLGDLADDWDKQDDLDLYRDTFDAAIEFVKTFDNEVYFCIGNHDISYVWQQWESGYSINAEPVVRKKMKELKKAFSDPEKFAFVHCIDNTTIFSHAGISAYYVMKHANTACTIEQLIYQINHDFGEKELWMDDSPIWVRMQGGYIWPFKGNYFQVIGHTPVKKPLFNNEQGLLSLDTFSTEPDGRTPIGDCRYVVVDTLKKTFRYADEEVKI